MPQLPQYQYIFLNLLKEVNVAAMDEYYFSPVTAVTRQDKFVHLCSFSGRSLYHSIENHFTISIYNLHTIHSLGYISFSSFTPLSVSFLLTICLERSLAVVCIVYVNKFSSFNRKLLEQDGASRKSSCEINTYV